MINARILDWSAVEFCSFNPCMETCLDAQAVLDPLEVASDMIELVTTRNIPS